MPEVTEDLFLQVPGVPFIGDGELPAQADHRLPGRLVACHCSSETSLRWNSQSSKVLGLDPGFSRAFQVEGLDPGFLSAIHERLCKISRFFIGYIFSFGFLPFSIIHSMLRIFHHDFCFYTEIDNGILNTLPSSCAIYSKYYFSE